METTVSTKGQVVLPQKARRELGIGPGTKLDCRIDGGSVVLTPKRTVVRKTRLVRDRVTGLIVTDGGPTVTSEQVRAALAEFP
ncbi:MAG TPA: AbrB/MazE/SpoVT family DNA-binding domain-containing protein [Opitutaceae bacterium]